jgi:hypothetical protein
MLTALESGHAKDGSGMEAHLADTDADPGSGMDAH